MKRDLLTLFLLLNDKKLKGECIAINYSKKQLKNFKEINGLISIISFGISIYITNDFYLSIVVGIAVALVGYFLLYVNDIENRKILRKSNIHDIDNMDGFQFEHYLVELFKSLNYTVKRTPDTGDFGADLILHKEGKRIVVQAKRYKGKVGVKAIQEIIGAKSYYKAHSAWVITNSSYTNSALTFANKTNVRLIDRDILIKMQKKSRMINNK